MAKTIKITFYNPKELWQRFWTWAFWPRRKMCSTWVDYARDLIKQDAANIVFEYKISGLIVSDKDADELYNSLVKKVDEHMDRMEELMTKPLYD